MVSTTKDIWLKFFLDAKIPESAAEEYTYTFIENRIQPDMLLDLDKDYLNAMGITVMGDIIAILKHAKVCHMQNAKKSMLSKKVSDSSLTYSNKPTPLTADSHYRSVTLKKYQPTASNSRPIAASSKPVPKPISKKVVTSLDTKVTARGKQLSRVKSTVESQKSLKTAVTNGTKLVEKEPSKPTLVRTPLVRKRSSNELKQAKEDEEEVESDSDIVKKMAKTSIFDRLGYQGEKKNSAIDISEKAVSSSTPSVVTSSSLSAKKTPSFENNTHKPGTLSYRMFPAHVHSTSSNDDLPDDGDRILIEVDLNDAKAPATAREEFTVALPPDYQTFQDKTLATSGKGLSVFDRLGGKRSQSATSSSNPGKSILKSSTLMRIKKPTFPLDLLPNKKDFNNQSTLNSKLSLIRSQVRTEGVLGKPGNGIQDKIPAKARIGTNESQIVASMGTKRRQVVTPTSSVKSRLTLSDKKLDTLAKSTLGSTPAHVKARIETEQHKFLSKAKCGSGIKARLGFKTRGEKDSDNGSRRTRSLSPIAMSSQIFEREIFTNGEEEAEMTLDGKKKVRFHCVEKKLIPHRHEDKIIQKRFSSSLPYRRVW